MFTSIGAFRVLPEGYTLGNKSNTGAGYESYLNGSCVGLDHYWSNEAQQNPAHKPDVEGLLVVLRSNDGGDRDRAYAQLKSDTETLRSSKVKEAFLDLLA